MNSDITITRDLRHIMKPPSIDENQPPTPPSFKNVAATTSPAHYRSHPSGIEPIAITRHESFIRGNIIKYVLRAPYSGKELADLRKAQQYLKWEIERVEQNS